MAMDDTLNVAGSLPLLSMAMTKRGLL
jgi:hypothetical protein